MGSIQLFVSNYQLPKPIEPRVARFNHPPLGFETGVLHFRKFFFSARTDMRRITSSNHFSLRLITGISSIGTKIFLFIFHNRLDNFSAQNGFKLTDIMPVRSGYDDGQRDATAVHKQMAFASFFSPGLWGLPQNFPAPTEPCTYSRL